ncbi:MAG: ABC transporter permease [Actinomycetota bacterium]|nr:ABC transporter permease [Actinomycetota bacterium]
MSVLEVARLLPLGLVGAERGRHMVERNLLVYRRSWVVLVSGALEPLFYLFAIGIGVGGLVGGMTGPGGEPLSYATFIAPALLAASAMNGSVFEMYNVYFKLKYEKLYDAALATPMQPRDIVVGEVTWALVRSGLYASGFLVVAMALRLVESWWGLLAVPAALLIGFCFAAATIAGVTYMRSWQDFDLLLLFTIPMFLFSATFYPIDVYPPSYRWITQLSPLYHGVEIVRALMLGALDVTLIGHVAVLIGLGSGGVIIAARRIERLLLA